MTYLYAGLLLYLMMAAKYEAMAIPILVWTWLYQGSLFIVGMGAVLLGPEHAPDWLRWLAASLSLVPPFPANELYFVVGLVGFPMCLLGVACLVRGVLLPGTTNNARTWRRVLLAWAIAFPAMWAFSTYIPIGI